KNANGVRKKLFRATAGLSLYEQSNLANSIANTGNNVLETIENMKIRSQKQKKSTKESTAKFQWLHDHMHLKKLEQAATKDVDAMILKMVNDIQTNSDATPDTNTYEASIQAAVEEIQAQRLKQLTIIQNDRENRVAMKRLLSNIQKEAAIQGPDWFSNVKVQLQRLMLDSIIGQHTLYEQLWNEASICEKGLQQACQSLCRDRSNISKSIGIPPEEVWKQLLASIIPERNEEDSQDDMLLDPIIKYNTLLEFESLQRHLNNDLAELESKYKETIEPLGCEYNGSIASKHPGWTDEDHERYLKIFKDCEPKGIRNDAFLTRLTPVLPNKSKKELGMHDKWYRTNKRYLQQTQERQAEYTRKYDQTFEKSKACITEAIETQKLKQSTQSEMARRTQMQAILHAKVEKFQLKRSVKAELIAHQNEIARLEAEAIQNAIETKRKKEYELKKKLLQDHKGWQELNDIAKEEALAKERQIEEELKLERDTINAERVLYRKKELEAKTELQKQHIQLEALEEQERIRALEALKLETPYAEKLSQIQMDPERTRQPTVAFQANVEAANEALPVHEAGLFPSHGYDTDKLFKDARFRLGIALQDAGLAKTEYAKHAMANITVRNAGSYRHSVQPKTQLW
ncbi:hypothetical protein THRCLA_07136, partial [Thraustotheca clavata]